VDNGATWGSVSIAPPPPPPSGGPTITTVSGLASNGSTITIGGSGFGTTELPYLLDTVENQADYAGSVSGDEVPYDPAGPWEDHDYSYDGVFLEESGGKPNSLMHYKTGVGTGFLSWPTASDNATSEEIYVSWQYKPNEHPYDNGGSSKCIRIWDEGNGLSTRISWTANQMTYGTDGNLKSNGRVWSGNVGQWNLMEVYANKGTGVIKTWINGQLDHNIKDFESASTPVGLRVKLIGFDPRSSAEYPNQVTEFDDIYMAPTRARVEVTTSATYSLSDERVVQEATAWADGSISINFRQGQLSTGTAYLYVFDADNTVSPAYPVEVS
jgi:hypothetical protein